MECDANRQRKLKIIELFPSAAEEPWPRDPTLTPGAWKEPGILPGSLSKNKTQSHTHTHTHFRNVSYTSQRKACPRTRSPCQMLSLHFSVLQLVLFRKGRRAGGWEAPPLHHSSGRPSGSICVATHAPCSRCKRASAW